MDVDLKKEMRNYLIRHDLFNEHLFNRYWYLIDRFSNSGNIAHHILPKSIFPEYKSFTYYPNNKCLLSERQHYIIHFVLAKLFGRSMWVAFTRMNTNLKGEKQNSILYELSREYFKKHQANILKNTICVNDGLNNYYVYEDELSTMLICGLKKGNTQKGKKKTYKSNWYHDPKTNEIWRGEPGKQPPGFVKGRPKIGKFNGFANINKRENYRNPLKNRIGYSNGKKTIYLEMGEDPPKGFNQCEYSKFRLNKE